jgi:hypothetical protein
MSTLPSDRSATAAAASGAVAGVVAWSLGYAVTFLLAGQRVEAALSDLNAFVGLVGGNEVPTWKAVGWLYLNAHTVVLQVGGLPGGTQSYDLVAESGGDATLLYFVPLVALVVVTAVVVAAIGVRDAATGAIGGAGAVVGYLLVTGLVTFLAGHSFGGGVTAAPAPVAALFLAGFAYPFTLGSFTGAIVGALRP